VKYPEFEYGSPFELNAESLAGQLSVSEEEVVMQMDLYGYGLKTTVAIMSFQFS